MLLSFTVSNYRSFDEEQTFSLIASKRHSGDHENHVLPIIDSEEQVLRAAVLYGANGAGKSNLFRALQFLRDLATDSRDRDDPMDRDPFLLRDADRPSTFDVQFLSTGGHYRYGITIDDERILEEWLARIVGGKEQTIFERSTSIDGNVKVKITETDAGDKEQKAKLEALATVGGPRNQSFLATVFANLDKWPLHFLAAIHWFHSQLRLIPPQDPRPRTKGTFATDPELRRFAGAFLNAASTGIDQLAAKETVISEEDLSAMMPLRARQRLSVASAERPASHILPNGDVVTATKLGDEVIYRLINIETGHRDQKGEVVLFQVEQESDGTRRLLELIPALHAMYQQPRCYFIDEIDRSLHPILVHDFLGFFLRSCEGRQAQLIVTTHESNLLDQALLRRDEIWFAEKNREGATVLYSLLDFNPRNDMQLRKNYLQGRFGAIPFLGGIEDLLEQRKVD